MPPTTPLQDINDPAYYADMQRQIESVSNSLNALIKVQGISGEAAKNIRKTYTDLGKDLRDLNDLHTRIMNGTLKTRDVTKQIEEMKKQSNYLAIQRQNAIDTGNKKLKTQITKQQIITDQLMLEFEFLEKSNKLIDQKIGLVGKLIQGLHGVPSLNRILNLDEATTKMRKLADEGAGGVKIAITGLKTAFEGLGKYFTLAFFIDGAFKADKQVTQIAKTLMLTKKESNQIREDFIDIANSSNDSFYSTTKLLEANANLAHQLGVNKIFSAEMNKSFINLTTKIGLSVESAAGLAKLSIANGTTLKKTEQTIAGITSRLSAQNGIQLDGKEIMEEVGKVSGQLLANFQGNPKAIAEAVAQAKLLGITLEQTKKQSESLLNFESSLENELKAELLTGQQINLEKARSYALTGDMVGVMKELSNQNMNFTKFSHMNVLAQKSFAESLGLSSDELSNQLLKQQYLGKSISEVRALGDEDAAKRLEAMSAQDKFAASMEKIKEIVSNLVDGPLGRMLDVISNIASSSGLVYTTLAAVAGISLAKAIAQGAVLVAQWSTMSIAAIATASATTLGLGAVTIIAGIAAVTAAMNSAKTSIDDGVIGSDGGLVVSGPKGSIQLNKDDSIIAGTNLGGGGGKSADLAPLIKAVNAVKTSVDKLYNKEGVVNLDGRKLGTLLVQGSYKSA